MSGRTIFRVVAVLALIGLLAAGGVTVYNAGVAEGLAEAARAAAASGDQAPIVFPPYAGHYGWGGGFGIFGLLFLILGIFLIIGLVRAAFGGGRWGGPGGRGWADRRERIEELHRELHRSGDQPQGSSS